MELGPTKPIKRRLREVGIERRFWEPSAEAPEFVGRLSLLRTKPTLVVEISLADDPVPRSFLNVHNRNYAAGLNSIMINGRAETVALAGVDHLRKLVGMSAEGLGLEITRGHVI
ncbi:hypothetical protein A3J32_00675 [Candidatus Saccharibacteria bacterium RIFCSPLOWO2_02_FULL_46_7]|nr:MAG: hypothetical protein A3J32_00675 [Candidatus Saccharibacteria bacterium RIFCSPLOWO2_02_FULL_46_7]